MSLPEAGKKFGRWTVLSQGSAPLLWLCRCDCPAATEKQVNKKNLKAGKSTSCGCLQKELVATLATRRKPAARNHGKTKTPEYAVWAAMKHRCMNENYFCYDDYGGRGIKVCDRWMDSFLAFLEDMGRRPSPDHSIDRIDNDGDYTPENCRWATDTEQNRNSRRTRDVTWNGKTQCLAAWAEETGIPYNVIGCRLDMGWDIERALTEPVNRNILNPEQVAEIRKRYDKGSFKNGGPALAKEFGVSFQTIHRIANNEIRRYADEQDD